VSAISSRLYYTIQRLLEVYSGSEHIGHLAYVALLPHLVTASNDDSPLLYCIPPPNITSPTLRGFFSRIACSDIRLSLNGYTTYLLTFSHRARSLKLHAFVPGICSLRLFVTPFLQHQVSQDWQLSRLSVYALPNNFCLEERSSIRTVLTDVIG
jgi:hypothetical protein